MTKENTLIYDISWLWNFMIYMEQLFLHFFLSFNTNSLTYLSVIYNSLECFYLPSHYCSFHYVIVYLSIYLDNIILRRELIINVIKSSVVCPVIRAGQQGRLKYLCPFPNLLIYSECKIWDLLIWDTSKHKIKILTWEHNMHV